MLALMIVGHGFESFKEAFRHLPAAGLIGPPKDSRGTDASNPALGIKKFSIGHIKNA